MARAENTLSAFHNIAGHLDAFVSAIVQDVEALGGNADNLTALRQALTEELISQFGEDFSNAWDRSEANPLVRKAA